MQVLGKRRGSMVLMPLNIGFKKIIKDSFLRI